MAFITETDIKVVSRIENLDDFGLPDGEDERSETTYRAFIKELDGGVEITYTERDESGAKTLTTITVLDDEVTLNRHGAVETVMSFKEGKIYNTLYTVSPYSFDAKVVTKRLRSNITRHGGELAVFYELTVGGASKKVQLRITVA